MNHSENLIKAFALRNGDVLTNDLFFKTLEKQGIQRRDPRIQGIDPNQLFSDKGKSKNRQTSAATEKQIVRKAIQRQQIIPDFEDFTHSIDEIYAKVKKLNSGKVAEYIPQLSRVDPDLFSISICTADGQTYSVGDHPTPFTLQSTHKPINYAIALEELGAEVVHQHVGKEPSGVSFNALTMNQKGLPHNPLVNAGAIMSAALLECKESPADRFDCILNIWKELNGQTLPTFNNSIYQSEKATADRNFALAYLMKENKAFPDDVDIRSVLDFFFQCCSIEVDSAFLARVGATFANSGINPFTNKSVFKPETVKSCLSMMYSCGMYDYSGEFAFTIGIPAKSGVCGAIWMVVPNVMGICVYSPRLDQNGNSVKGIAVAGELIKRYNFHNYDSLNFETQNKKDPRRKKYETKTNKVMSLIFAASDGDLDEIRRLNSIGLDLNEPDYDGRTALHLAAAENQVEVVKYLLEEGVNKNPKDRWGATPISDARRGEFLDVINLLSPQKRSNQNRAA